MEEDIARLGQLKREIDRLSGLRKEYDELRQDVLFQMMSLKSLKSEPVNGYQALRIQRKSVSVSDPSLVEDWLTVNGYDLDEYRRLDLDRVKALSEQVEKQYKTPIQGVTTNVVEYVQIKEVT
jgi:phage host-nuclease inhibitor protein Gam